MMRNIDNERTRFGIYGSLVAHLLALLLIAFTGVLQSGAHNLSDVTEIAFMGGGGGGGGGGQGDGSSVEMQEPAAAEAGAEEEEQAQQPAPEPAEDVITESAGESRQEPKPRVQPQAAAVSKKAAAAPKKRGNAPGSGGGIGTGHGTGIGSGTGPGSGSGSGGGHGSGHGTGIGSGIGPGIGYGRGIASSPAVPPRIVQSVAPYYPTALKQQGVEGLTVVRLVVGTNGAVESAEILRSSGNGSLDSSALDAARQWRFTAAKNSAGQKVRCYFDLPLRFKITYN